MNTYMHTSIQTYTNRQTDKDRQTDTDRQINRQRWTDREAEHRQTGRKKAKQTDGQT